MRSALAGTVAGAWALRGLLALAPAGLPRREEITIDLPVLGVMLLLAIIGGIALLAGRSFAAGDPGPRAIVAVIDNFARDSLLPQGRCAGATDPRRRGHIACDPNVQHVRMYSLEEVGREQATCPTAIDRGLISRSRFARRAIRRA